MGDIPAGLPEGWSDRGADAVGQAHFFIKKFDEYLKHRRKNPRHEAPDEVDPRLSQQAPWLEMLGIIGTSGDLKTWRAKKEGLRKFFGQIA